MNKRIYKVFLSVFLMVSTYIYIPFTNLIVLAKSNIEPFYNAYEQYVKTIPPKYQLISGPCWAFASMASLEVFLARKGMLKKSLSERHLLSWVHQGQGKEGFNYKISDGGSIFMATAYFTSLTGPIFAKEMPYNIEDCIFDETATKKKPAYFVKGIKLINNDIESIKSAITEYGAVTAAYDKHAVSIVGWDSSHKKWAVRDSGCRKGYGWLSFGTKFFYCISFTDAEPYDERKNIYQHDKFGAINTVKSSENLYCANVYDFNGNETLDSVMIKSDSEGALCELYYAPVLLDGKPNNNTKTWIKLNAAKIPYQGYTTFSLEKKLKLNKGKGAIVVKISGEDNVEKTLIAARKDKQAILLPKTNISFILLNDTFYDVNEVFRMRFQKIQAFSIKAITSTK